MRACLRSEEWFPAIATLLRHSEAYAPPALPEPRRTPEEREADRQAAKRGLEMIENYMREKGLWA